MLVQQHPSNHNSHKKFRYRYSKTEASGEKIIRGKVALEERRKKKVNGRKVSTGNMRQRG